MTRPNKGRRAQKNWHKREDARKWESITWPDLNVVAIYDGTPQPRPQGNYDNARKPRYRRIG